jgi:hypothetical protein
MPNEGDLLYSRPLSEWNSDDWDVGWREATESSLHIGVYGGDGHTVAAWTGRTDFADISASVDVREVTNGTESIGCLAVRHDVALGEYMLCVLSDGRTWATYDYSDANGAWHSQVLLDVSHRAGTNPASEWSTLKISIRGNEIWYLANGTLLGTATHDARSVGAVDIHVTNWDATTAEWEFKRLVVRSVS